MRPAPDQKITRYAIAISDQAVNPSAITTVPACWSPLEKRLISAAIAAVIRSRDP